MTVRRNIQTPIQSKEEQCMTNLITKNFRPDFENGIFDILFRDVLDATSLFSPVNQAKFHYPVDVIETSDGIEFDFAVVGVDKKDIKLEIDNDTLKIIYENNQNRDGQYIYKGITRKSFNFAWKLGGRFDTTQVVAAMDKGILNIKIPFTKAAIKKVVTIN